MEDRFEMVGGHSPALPLAAPRAADVRVRMDDEDAVERLRVGLIRVLQRFPAARREHLVYLCIGTDRSTGDCLGPLVGTMLLEAGLPRERVHGTLADPVHAANLAERLKAGLAGASHPEPVVLAVDACLGQARSIGSISLGLGALRPGAGVNKNLPPVGDIYITGTVNVGGFMEYFVLQNTRLHLVMEMARVISEALIRAARDPAPYPRRQPPLQRFFPLR